MQVVQSSQKNSFFLIAIQAINLVLTIVLLLNDKWFSQTWKFTSSTQTFTGGLISSNFSIIGVCKKHSLYSKCYAQCQIFTKKHSIDEGTCERYNNWNVAGYVLIISLIIGTFIIIYCILAVAVQMTNWRCIRIRRFNIKLTGYLSIFTLLLYFIGFGIWAIKVKLTIGKCENYYGYEGTENVCLGESAIIMMFTLIFMLFTTHIYLTIIRKSEIINDEPIELKKMLDKNQEIT